MYKFLITLLLICTSTVFASSSKDIEKQEKQLIELVNKERTKRGLKPLKEQSDLTKIARKHSQNMADKKVSFGHDGFDTRFKQAKEIGARRFGENVAYSHNMKDPLQTAVNSWMKSRDHKDNILGDYKETGIGIAYDKKGKFFVTQLFAVRK